MLELGHDARFAGEARGERRILPEGGVQHLDGDVPVERGVVGLEDRRHSPLAELFDDAVGTDVLTDDEGHGASPGNRTSAPRPAAPGRETIHREEGCTQPGRT